MAGRWRNPSAFRADPDAAPAAAPSRRQTIVLLTVLILVAAAVAVASYVIRPEKARAFDLFHGSLFLTDQRGPVAVDLSSGNPTLRLVDADKQVDVTGTDQLAVVPLIDHTLLLNEATGEFNMVDNGGFVVKHDGGGVPLTPRAGTSSSIGIAATSGEAYIIRTGATGGTDVYLVSQPTVESAINATTAKLRPRASGFLPEPGSTAPGGAASANGDLWLLLGAPGGAQTIRELSVPPGSSAGATLTPANQGQVNGPAAITTATSAPDGSGTTTVAVASATHIDVFPADGRQSTVTIPSVAGLDSVLPTSNAQGRLAFLMHGTQGWYVTSIGADGGAVRAPTLVKGLPADARLAEPAISNGRLYTIDTASGQLYQLGYDATAQSLAGVPRYPIPVVRGKLAETADFRDAYVVARGPRVIYNSAHHADAVMVFTDGSRAPRTIIKGSAVTVSAAGGAEALTKSTVPPGQQPPKSQNVPPKSRPQNEQPVNTKIDCKTANQKPHIPVITSAVPGSRSVTLTWRYPVIDVQDCFPSTYVVSVKRLSNNAPAGPSSVPVHAQTGATISGLFPSTRYAITVTAYINGEGTDSLPTTIITGVEGPPAPTGLVVSADSAGSWQLHWDSCGTVQEGCVPTQSWTVTPSFCDGRGVSSPPPPMTVTADPTSKRQPPAVYRGSDSLLGRGLQFQVQGTGDEGQAGAPSGTSACVYSWTPPVAADLSVQASTPPQTSSGLSTTSTTATVHFANGQLHDLGGVGGTLTYELLNGSTLIDRVGPTTSPSATLHGIHAAARYQVKVLASPPRHPDVVVPIGPVDVVPAIAAWPTPLVSTPTFDAPRGTSGTLHVSFRFPIGTRTLGETFALVNSQLSCGNTALTLNASDAAPGDDLTFPIDRRTYNGACTVTIQLAQDGRTVTDPPLYGAGNSPSRTSGTFDIDPPSLTSTAGDFQAQWGGSNTDPTVVVSYHGQDDLSGASNWRMTVTRGDDQNCGGTNGNPPPATLTVDKDCVANGSGPFQVDIRYTYFILAQAHFTVNVSGQAPQPVDPTRISFTAQWNANPDLPQVDVIYTGSEDRAALAPLNWTEVVSSGGVSCATEHDNPGTSSVRIDVDLTVCPPTNPDGTAATYTVDVSFTDPNYGRTGDYPNIPVDGSPPIQ